MDVIYWLIPSMIFVGIVLVILLAMGVKKGHYEDLEGEGQRILFDEDEGEIKTKKKQKIGVDTPFFLQKIRT